RRDRPGGGQGLPRFPADAGGEESHRGEGYDGAMKTVLAFLILALSFAAEAAVTTDTWAAEPIPSPKPIFFATASTSGTVGGHVLRGERSLYSVNGKAGQTMTVTLTTPD